MDEFLINLCNQESDINSIKGEANAAENAMTLANKIRDGIYKDLLIKRIAQEYDLPEEDISEMPDWYICRTIIPQNKQCLIIYAHWTSLFER